MKNKLFITGAFGGLGEAILYKFLKKKYFCYCVTTKKNNENNLIKKYKNQIKILKIDFTQNSWKEDLSFEIKKINKIDTLVNCAGINIIKNFEKITENDFLTLNKINYESIFFVTQILLKKLYKSKNPRIVNISSIWSTISKAKRSLYSGSKGAINSLTRELSIELATKNILANSVSPGFFKTKLTLKSLNKKEFKSIIGNIPLKRLGEPDEIAELIYFLGTKNNSYLTGQNIICDGGFSIK